MGGVGRDISSLNGRRGFGNFTSHGVPPWFQGLASVLRALVILRGRNPYRLRLAASQVPMPLRSSMIGIGSSNTVL